MAFFDCDGTLTKVRSSWEYIHRRLNIWDDYADHYQALFRAGKIDYYEFCRRDALLWRGLPVSRVIDILGEISYQAGASEVIRALKERGIRTVILSTGLSLLVEKVGSELGVDMAVSNELVSDKGYLTGELKINVNYGEKGYLVRRILNDAGLGMAEACAVGDGHGDEGMFQEVGLPVEFCGGGLVAGVVRQYIQGESLIDLMRIIGEYGG